ncbi:hypothetical protein [Halalkalicoccus tibetensis]|uniref:Short chain dehydrogenase n=1 Tax=Halalkalicoccus tibetensis TaxID=175632 RepID=A0ABD5V132_9EURY
MDDTTAVVTGVSRGIGEAVAPLFVWAAGLDPAEFDCEALGLREWKRSIR